VNCRVACEVPFDPDDTQVTVVYLNASGNASAYMTVPADEGERRLWGPGVAFDGQEGVYNDPMYIERHGDRIPTAFATILPGRTCSVRYRISDRFQIPKSWTNLSVRAVHEYQCDEYQFEFDRVGLLVQTTLLRRIDRAEVLAGRDRVLDGRARWEAMRRTGTPHRVRSHATGTNVGVSAVVAPAVKSGPPEDRAESVSRSDCASPRTVHFSGRIFGVVLLSSIAGGALVMVRGRRHGQRARDSSGSE
jgi:hypothetical protein